MTHVIRTTSSKLRHPPYLYAYVDVPDRVDDIGGHGVQYVKSKRVKSVPVPKQFDFVEVQDTNIGKTDSQISEMDTFLSRRWRPRPLPKVYFIHKWSQNATRSSTRRRKKLSKEKKLMRTLDYDKKMSTIFFDLIQKSTKEQKYSIRDSVAWATVPKLTSVGTARSDPTCAFKRGDAVALCTYRFINDNVVEHFSKYFVEENPKVHVLTHTQIAYMIDTKTGAFKTKPVRQFTSHCRNAIPDGHLESGGYVCVMYNYPSDLHWVFVAVSGKPSLGTIQIQIRNDMGRSEEVYKNNRHVGLCVAKVFHKVISPPV